MKHSPHQVFFKHFFSKPDAATELLRSMLPADIRDVLDFSTLRLFEPRNPSDNFCATRPEILFEAKLTDSGEPCFLLMILIVGGNSASVYRDAIEAACAWSEWLGGVLDLSELPHVPFIVPVVVHI